MNENIQKYIIKVKEFLITAKKLGHGDLSKYYWYHTVDLGNGLVTPGDYDYRPIIDVYDFPKDMKGMNVLDIGSATGFFTFEFEKRGADVVSLELPSLFDWDMLFEEDKHALAERMSKEIGSRDAETLHFYHLDGPFKFCSKVLGSKASRIYSTIYDLDKSKTGIDTFDLVFLGDVLLHTASPLKALISASNMCRRTLIICDQLYESCDPHPLLYFASGDADDNNRTWWHPNMPFIDKTLKKLGFKSVEIIGYNTGICWPLGISYSRRAVIKAER